jgi:uracil phosphoribosyltransferase
MKISLSSEAALKCLDNKITGTTLYKRMSDFTSITYADTNKFWEMDFDVIITVLRAALPMGMTLYQITNKKIGFISAKRQKDLSIEINYKNIPEFKNPLIVDGWVASGNTIVAVAKELGIKKINLFGLIASQHALDLIKPDNYIVGCVAEKMTDKFYIIPPEPFRPRDGGDDLFINR